MNSKFAKDLKISLKEALAHKEGKLDLYSEYIEVPKQPIEYKSKEIKKKRKFRDYQDKLIQDLQDPELASAYLNAALIDKDQ